MQSRFQGKEVGDAKIELGKLIKDARSRLNKTRGQFAYLVGGISRQFLESVEHGCPPPRRRIILKIIDNLNLSKIEREKAISSLNLFSSRRKRVKLHSKYKIRTRRIRFLTNQSK